MKIALNCAFLQPQGGGVKEYIENLMNNLAKQSSDHQFIIYILKDQVEYAKKYIPEQFQMKIIPFNSQSKWDRIKRSILEKKYWLKEEKEEKFDIFHSPFFHSPSFKTAKVLLTVHDLRLYRFPETYEFFRYHFLKHKVKSSIKKADHIISISDFTKNEIMELCGISPEKITVIHEAINPEKFNIQNLQESEDIPLILKNNPFILSVGHLEPRKNYDRLIEAFIKLKQDPKFNQFQLVLVGKKNHSYKTTLKKIEQTSGVHYLNFVSENSLLWLYKKASLFIFPSYYEGFGFPPLEAASLETISAVSNISSMPEVCEDTVFYFNPFDIDDMSKVIKQGLTDKAAILEKKNKTKDVLKKFSWQKNAKETLGIYKSLLD